MRLIDELPPLPISATPKTPTLPRIDREVFERFFRELPNTPPDAPIKKLDAENEFLLAFIGEMYKRIEASKPQTPPAPQSVGIILANGQPARPPATAGFSIEEVKTLANQVVFAVYELLDMQLKKDAKNAVRNQACDKCKG